MLQEMSKESPSEPVLACYHLSFVRHWNDGSAYLVNLHCGKGPQSPENFQCERYDWGPTPYPYLIGHARVLEGYIAIASSSNEMLGRARANSQSFVSWELCVTLPKISFTDRPNYLCVLLEQSKGAH